jgi:hypothetical protein
MAANPSPRRDEKILAIEVPTVDFAMKWLSVCRTCAAGPHNIWADPLRLCDTLPCFNETIDSFLGRQMGRS